MPPWGERTREERNPDNAVNGGRFRLILRGFPSNSRSGAQIPRNRFYSRPSRRERDVHRNETGCFNLEAVASEPLSCGAAASPGSGNGWMQVFLGPMLVIETDQDRFMTKFPSDQLPPTF